MSDQPNPRIVIGRSIILFFEDGSKWLATIESGEADDAKGWLAGCRIHGILTDSQPSPDPNERKTDK